MTFNPNVFSSPSVQFALKCCCAFFENDFYEFFRLTSKANTLEFCLLSEHFPQLRSNACNTVKNSFNANGIVPLKYFYETFFFEDENECTEFFSAQGIPIDNDQVLLKNASSIFEIGQIKRRIGFKFIQSFPSNEKIKNLILGQKENIEDIQVIIKEPMDKKEILQSFTAELTTKIFKNITNEIIMKEHWKFSLSSSLTKNFFSDFFELNVKNDLYQYCCRVKGQVKELNESKHKMISCQIFDVIFPQIIKEIVQEECFFQLEIKRIKLKSKCNQIVRSFRMKQTIYLKILDYLQEKINHYQNNHIKFISFLQRLPIEMLFIEKFTSLQQIYDLYYSFDHLVMFFDNLDFMNEICFDLSRIGISYTVVLILSSTSNQPFANQPSPVHQPLITNQSCTLSIDFYSISSWVDTLNRLFIGLDSLKLNSLSSKKLLDLGAFILNYFDVCIFRKWNFFEKAKCNSASLIDFPEDIFRIIEELFSKLNYYFYGKIQFNNTQTNISNVCCSFHLSKIVYDKLKEMTSCIPSTVKFLTEQDINLMGRQISLDFNSFLLKILGQIYFYPQSAYKRQPDTKSSLNASLELLLQEVNEEHDKSTEFDSIISTLIQ